MPAPQPAAARGTRSVNANVEPAYNLTVDRDHCYFVKGNDGRAYLVANSSHCADALKTLCLGIRTIRPEPTPAFYTTQFDPMHDHAEAMYESEFEIDPAY